MIYVQKKSDRWKRYRKLDHRFAVISSLCYMVLIGLLSALWVICRQDNGTNDNFSSPIKRRFDSELFDTDSGEDFSLDDGGNKTSTGFQDESYTRSMSDADITPSSNDYDTLGSNIESNISNQDSFSGLSHGKLKKVNSESDAGESRASPIARLISTSTTNSPRTTTRKETKNTSPKSTPKPTSKPTSKPFESSSINKTTSVKPNAAKTTTKKSDIKSNQDNNGTKQQIRTTKRPLLPSISERQVVVEERDISYFLESHLAHNMHDVRSLFTSEQTTRSLVVAKNELCNYPKQLRFAYLVRVFLEMGRKLASRSNLIASDIVALLKRMPDDFGNKPDTSMIMDVIYTTFEGRDERPIPDSEYTIGQLIGEDEDKKRVYQSSVDNAAEYLANTMAFVAMNSTKTCIENVSNQDVDAMPRLLTQAIRKGSDQMAKEMNSLDKFSLSLDGRIFLNQTINRLCQVIDINLSKLHAKSNESHNAFGGIDNLKLSDLNHLTEARGLIGSWNNYLFFNLGSAERVVKLFSSLLQRVPNSMKSRWINMYSHSALSEMRRTLSGFVSMQTYPYKLNNSESILLKPSKEARLLPSKIDQIRKDYNLDKERLPARCYLAGRRWRLFIVRSLREYSQLNDVIKKFADSISKWRLELLRESPNDINYKLCLPRLEVGLLGWSINGDPQGPEQAKSQFPLKNPLQRLKSTQDPFLNGFKLGYKIGFLIGYNEERNASLEIEMSNNNDQQHLIIQDRPRSLVTGNATNNLANQMSAKTTSSNSLPQTDYVGRLSYRKASSASANRVFAISLEEGYLSSLKIPLKAGIRIAAEAGSFVGEIRGKTYGSQEGREVGRVTAGDVIYGSISLPEKLQKELTIEGEKQGLEAGTRMGGLIGSIAGHEGAIEAYLQTLLSGGQLRFARFHMGEFIKGAKKAFENGFDVGKLVASSSKLDPSAPRYLKLSKPQPGKFDVDSSESWQDLIPLLNQTVVDRARYEGNQIVIDGKMKGKYHFSKEIKRELVRVSITNETQDIEINVHGFMHNDIAYLNINGSINSQGLLHGALVASRIIDIRSWQ